MNLSPQIFKEDILWMNFEIPFMKIHVWWDVAVSEVPSWGFAKFQEVCIFVCSFACAYVLYKRPTLCYLVTTLILPLFLGPCQTRSTHRISDVRQGVKLATFIAFLLDSDNENNIGYCVVLKNRCIQVARLYRMGHSIKPFKEWCSFITIFVNGVWIDSSNMTSTASNGV